MAKTLKSLVGGGSKPLVYEQMFIESLVWRPIYDSEVVIYVCGGGGSGGAANVGSPDDNNVLATGGGAGEVAIYRGMVYANTDYTVTIGAGGVGPTAPASSAGSTAANGAAGGITSFVGGDINITANGGLGGRGGYTPANTPLTVLGGLGGTGGTGGKIHYTGGRGGDATCDSTAGFAGIATGGGGVNLFGSNNTRGGDVVYTGENGTRLESSHTTGGGGAWGHGGDRNDNQAAYTVGGTGFSSAPDNSQVTPELSGNEYISGIVGSCLLTTLRGRGGKGYSGSGSDTSASPYFGGNGGRIATSSTGSISGGPAQAGGGGKAVVHNIIQTGRTATGGNGGNGFVLIQYLEAVGA